MEEKKNKLSGHAAHISAMLQKECRAPNAGALAISDGFKVVIPKRDTPPFQQIASDLGGVNSALLLPVEGKTNRKYWIGMHETWEAKGKHTIRFVECSLRLYVSSNGQEPGQFLRLEWAAQENDGSYPGDHAAHPHWHIDPFVLAGADRFLSILTTSSPSAAEATLESFSPATAISPSPLAPFHDCSWIHKIHLPAQAEWMFSDWDGENVPHQREPEGFEALLKWWTGALHYVVSELSNLKI